jgi:phosphoribosylanthranilate isomerase
MMVKVCGMRDPENIQSLVHIKPDLLGLIFYPESKRYVGKLDPKKTVRLAENTKLVGVFVDETPESIKPIVDRFNLRYVQLHGGETVETATNLSDYGIGVIKAFGVDETFNFDVLKDFVGSVDYFLFDTKSKEKGGTGKKFSWELLNAYHLEVPYFLSGGISPDDFREIRDLQKHDKRLAGVDINSRFEDSPGYKNIRAIHEFIENINKA